jgi:hypothetical protein
MFRLHSFIMILYIFWNVEHISNTNGSRNNQREVKNQYNQTTLGLLHSTYPCKLTPNIISIIFEATIH